MGAIRPDVGFRENGDDTFFLDVVIDGFLEFDGFGGVKGNRQYAKGLQ